jgi:hypothetical protein
MTMIERFPSAMMHFDRPNLEGLPTGIYNPFINYFPIQ